MLIWNFAIIGVYICMNSRWMLASLGLICMAVGYLYTVDHFQLHTLHWRIFAGSFMGMLNTLNFTSFIQTGTVTTTSVLISVPILSLLVRLIFRITYGILDGDKENGRKTLSHSYWVKRRQFTLLAITCSACIIIFGLFGLIITAVTPIWTHLSYS